ncbi:MAG: Ig-like domain-containing protein [Bacteroidales bacterium]|nr:Ig-like domain-containing protein [Bacteroidales bacterium]
MDSNGKPTVTEVMGGVKSITITPQEGSSFEVGKEYRIVLRPQTLGNGYTLTLRKGSQAVDFISTGEKVFSRSDARRKANADSGLEWSGEFVAMGDGIYWATKNIGANNPQESGYYFAWGETETKTSYSWDTYKWGTAYNELTKYNDDSNFGTVDNPTYLYLQSDDDAARVNLGPGWLTPQKSDWQWLIDNCTWEWTDDYDGSGAKGYVVTSNVDGYTSNSIFLPAAGFYMNATARQRHLGYYWSANHGRMNPAVGEEKCVPYMAWYMSFTSSGHQVSSVDRIYGIPVRPIYREVAATGVFISSTSLALDYGEEASLTAIVLPASATNRNVIWSSSDPSIVSVTQEGALTAVGIGTATVTVTTEDGGYTGSCSVTVTGISVESVSLDHTILTIAKDATAQLTATVLPENASNPAVTWSSSDETIATVSEDGIVTGIKAGSATITVTTEDGNKTTSCQVTVEMAINGHTFVEMGDGLKWATMNVGATSEANYGDYFDWGETSPKTDYSWATYQHMYSGMTTYTGINKYQVADNQTSAMWYDDGEFVGDGITELERTDDVASANWGGTWRMPTDAEWTELRNNAKFTWSWDSTRKGYTVTSKVLGYVGNHIFLPAAGLRNGTSPYRAGSYGYYWSSSLYERDSDTARGVDFDSVGVDRDYDNRCYGFSVRPVSE